ncbi:hypothetical protein LX36DRAFT_730559 [Colletotrichum falcatum]|nr:hypothetical protein LX36DRAFT_730559 [Colletotrichum falcatum]
MSLPTDSRQTVVLGAAWAFIVTVTIFMGIRLYIRGYRMRRAWKLDDTMFILSSIVTIAQCVVVQLCAIYAGFGQHIWMVPLSSVMAYSSYSAITMLAYNISFGFIKASFLLQYRRAFALPSITILCDIILVILLLMSLALLITNGVIMRNFLRGNFIPDISTARRVQTATYITGAAHLASDIVIFILPMALLGQMRLTKPQKIGLYASFGVGVFTSAISMFKIVTAHAAFASVDPLYDAVPVIIFSIAEPTSAIVFACVPLIRPLLRCGSSAETYANQMRLENSLQTRNPIRPQMFSIAAAERNINMDIEGHHTNVLVNGVTNKPSLYTTHTSTLTKQ